MTRKIWTHFHPNIPWKRHMKLASNGLSFFLGKEVWKCWIWVTLDKGQWMTLTVGCHKSSCTYLFDNMYTYIHLTAFKGFLEKKFENVESEWPWTTLGCHKSSCTHLFDNMYTYILLTGFNSFLAIYSLSIFPYKNKTDQTWSCCKIGHGQPRTIIWTNLVVPE